MLSVKDNTTKEVITIGAKKASLKQHQVTSLREAARVDKLKSAYNKRSENVKAFAHQST